MKNIIFILVILSVLSFAGCHSKNENPTPAKPTDSTLTQYGTPFANVPSPENATIYQVNIRAFGPSGNFAGVLARMDSMKNLGVNVIYLMPIFPVGVMKGVNSPYSVKNYLEVNSAFGTLTDLRAVVDAAHSRNMAVMLDWVANHTSWDNPWIKAHPTWYLQNASGEIQSPPNTNYTDVAQLNFDNSAMRAEMIRDMKYWVYTANVDGFRCDFADNPPSAFWTQAVDTLRNITTHKLLLLAEGSRSANYASGFDYNFGFNYYGTLKAVFGNSANVSTLNALNSSEYSGASGTQQIVRYLNNHDVNGSDGTALELFGGINGSLSAFVITAYMKGVPMIYNGQEVADPTRIPFPFTTVKIDWSTHPDVTAIYKKIIAERNASDVIRKGALTMFSSANVCAFTKSIGSDSIVVLANVRSTTQSFTLPAYLANSNRWKNVFDAGAAVSLSGSAQLGPFKYLVLKN